MTDYRAASAAKIPAKPRCNQQGNENEDVKSWMWEHSQDHHGAVLGVNDGMEDYLAQVTGTFRKCLNRQVDEDIRMQVCEKGGGKVLNSRKGYYTAKSVQPMFRQQ